MTFHRIHLHNTLHFKFFLPNLSLCQISCTDDFYNRLHYNLKVITISPHPHIMLTMVENRKTHKSLDARLIKHRGVFGCDWLYVYDL